MFQSPPISFDKAVPKHGDTSIRWINLLQFEPWQNDENPSYWISGYQIFRYSCANPQSLSCPNGHPNGHPMFNDSLFSTGRFFRLKMDRFAGIFLINHDGFDMF